MIIAALAVAALLAPQTPADPYYPYPNPSVPTMPVWQVNPDGTRMQCTPTATYCWPDTSGLPSYLEG